MTAETTCKDCGRVQGELGVSVECAVCHLTKAPVGRSVPLEASNSYCDADCPGYWTEPLPGVLWRGEARREFGYGLPPDDADRCYAHARDAEAGGWDTECLAATLTRTRAQLAEAQRSGDLWHDAAKENMAQARAAEAARDSLRGALEGGIAAALKTERDLMVAADALCAEQCPDGEHTEMCGTLHGIADDAENAAVAAAAGRLAPPRHPESDNDR